MIVELVGRVFEAVGRVRGGPAGDDLAHVGRELRALARPPRQTAPSDR